MTSRTNKIVVVVIELDGRYNFRYAKASKDSEKVLKCLLCNDLYPYSHRSDLDNHLLESNHVHMGILLENGLWPGTQEQANTIGYELWRDGLFKFENSTIKCSLCLTSIKNATKLLLHQMETEHIAKLKQCNVQAPLLYFCSVCDYVAGAESEYNDHLASDTHKESEASARTEQTETCDDIEIIATVSKPVKPTVPLGMNHILGHVKNKKSDWESDENGANQNEKTKTNSDERRKIKEARQLKPQANKAQEAINKKKRNEQKNEKRKGESFGQGTRNKEKRFEESGRGYLPYDYDDSPDAERFNAASSRGAGSRLSNAQNPSRDQRQQESYYPRDKEGPSAPDNYYPPHDPYPRGHYQPENPHYGNQNGGYPEQAPNNEYPGPGPNDRRSGPGDTYPASGPTERYLGPSDMYRGPSDRYRGPSDRYAGPSDRYPGPSDRYPGPSDRYPGPSDGYLGPSDGYPGPSDGYPGPSDGYPGPSDTYFGPSDMYPGPSDRYSEPGSHRYSGAGPSERYPGPGPSDRYPGPSDRYPGPSDRYSVPGPSDGYSDRYPGPPDSVPGPSGRHPGPSDRYPGPRDSVPGPPGRHPGSSDIYPDQRDRFGPDPSNSCNPGFPERMPVSRSRPPLIVDGPSLRSSRPSHPEGPLSQRPPRTPSHPEGPPSERPPRTPSNPASLRDVFVELDPSDPNMRAILQSFATPEKIKYLNTWINNGNEGERIMKLKILKDRMLAMKREREEEEKKRKELELKMEADLMLAQLFQGDVKKVDVPQTSSAILSQTISAILGRQAQAQSPALSSKSKDALAGEFDRFLSEIEPRASPHSGVASRQSASGVTQPTSQEEEPGIVLELDTHSNRDPNLLRRLDNDREMEGKRCDSRIDANTDMQSTSRSPRKTEDGFDERSQQLRMQINEISVGPQGMGNGPLAPYLDHIKTMAFSMEGVQCLLLSIPSAHPAEMRKLMEILITSSMSLALDRAGSLLVISVIENGHIAGAGWRWHFVESILDVDYDSLVQLCINPTSSEVLRCALTHLDTEGRYKFADRILPVIMRLCLVEEGWAFVQEVIRVVPLPKLPKIADYLNGLCLDVLLCPASPMLELLLAPEGCQPQVQFAVACDVIIGKDWNKLMEAMTRSRTHSAIISKALSLLDDQVLDSVLVDWTRDDRTQGRGSSLFCRLLLNPLGIGMAQKLFAISNKEQRRCMAECLQSRIMNILANPEAVELVTTIMACNN